MAIRPRGSRPSGAPPPDSRQQFLDKAFHHLNERLDPGVKSRLSSSDLLAILHVFADFYLKERQTLAVEVMRDLSRPRVERITSDDTETPKFLEDLQKL